MAARKANQIDRRTFLAGAGAFAALGARSGAALGVAAPTMALATDSIAPFSADAVKRLAQELAQAPFVKPKLTLPQPFSKLSQEQYRDITFKADRAIWRGQGLDSELTLMPMGWIFDIPVSISLVEDNVARPLRADAGLFSFGPLVGPPPQDREIGFSGFRVRVPLNRPDRFEDTLVFQGASYFRAVGREQVFGLAGRGLALNTGRPGGEEFPFFRAFFIERPVAGSQEISVHAVLDSPSTAGAYRFRIRPGRETVMDVSLTLYPRTDLSTVGLAPLTSMFLFGPGSRRFPQELRRAAYGSEGLAILNGAGERLWRPLNNPKRLQMSAFLDRDPKGFGLIQRSRALSDFDDLDARFERRPSAWIEPQGKWGFGSVELVEIPSEEDIHDNIVAFWRPAEPLAKNKVHEFTYRLYWTSAIPSDWPGAIVHQTRTGPGKRTGTFRYSVDFANVGLPAGGELPATQLTTSSGQVSGAAVKPYPEIGGVRVGFDFEPKGAEIAELRLALRSNDKRISEVWLQRWTRD